MNSTQLATLVKLLETLVAQEKPKASGFKPRSSYKPANKAEPKGKIPSEGRTERQIRNEVAVAKAFKKNGFAVTPRVDVFTWKGWQSKGYLVKKGEHGTFVKGVGTLFHAGQVSLASPVPDVDMTALIERAAKNKAEMAQEYGL